jgi:hypothetical protein
MALDERFGTEAAEHKPVPGAQLDWGGTNWDGKTLKKPSFLAGVSFFELYIFMWKLLGASIVFALPFAVIYLVIVGSH